MAKKTKKKPSILAPAGDNPAPPPARPDWDQVEADFFARESDLYRMAPVETFDDLDRE